MKEPKQMSLFEPWNSPYTYPSEDIYEDDDQWLETDDDDETGDN